MEICIYTQYRKRITKFNGMSVSDNRIYNGAGTHVLGTYKTNQKCMKIIEEFAWFKECMILFNYQTADKKGLIERAIEDKGHKLGIFYMPK